jgi:hypothetical protein
MPYGEMVTATIQTLFQKFRDQEFTATELDSALCASKAWKGNLLYRLLKYKLIKDVGYGQAKKFPTVMKRRNCKLKTHVHIYRLTSKAIQLIQNE